MGVASYNSAIWDYCHINWCCFENCGGIMKWQTKNPVAYADLTESQVSEICNGCGASKSKFRPPHYRLFKHQCCPHDYDYAVGGNWWDKVKADWRLRSRIRGRVKAVDIMALRDNLYLDDDLFPDFMIRQIYYRWADGYFLGVMFGGNPSFRFDSKKQWPEVKNELGRLCSIFQAP